MPLSIKSFHLLAAVGTSPTTVVRQWIAVAIIVASSARNCFMIIQQLVRRSEQTSEVQRIARTLPSSNYPLSKLSPASQKKRVTKVIEERKNLVQKLNKLQLFECNINDRQHNELIQLVSAIQNKDSATVSQLISEGESMLGADNNILKDAWQQDVIERLHFEKDQSKSGNITKCVYVALFIVGFFFSQRVQGKQMESNHHKDG